MCVISGEDKPKRNSVIRNVSCLRVQGKPKVSAMSSIKEILIYELNLGDCWGCDLVHHLYKQMKKTYHKSIMPNYLFVCNLVGFESTISP